MLLVILMLAASGIPVGDHSGMVLYTDLSGSSLFLGETAVSAERGSGFNPLSSGGRLYWKECPSGEHQRVVRDGATVFEAEFFSGPFPSPDGTGFLIALPGEIFIMDSDGTALRSIKTDEFPGSITAGGGSIWFVSSETGSLRHIDAETELFDYVELSFTPVTVQYAGGLLLLERADGGFSVNGTDGSELFREENGFMPRFLGESEITFTRWAVSDGCEALEWETVSLPLGGQMSTSALPSFNTPVAGDLPMDEPSAHFDVPYMHQRWDTPDWFNGSWSCGPTSCMMAVQYYSRLTPDSIWCSYPEGHWSQWGNYIPEEYTFLGYTYDVLGLAAGNVWVPGSHGFICREYGGAVWAYMTDWMNRHGLNSSQIGTTWSACTSELNSSWPVVASTTSMYTSGHILLFNGYYDNHSVICNDSYGNQNLPGWGTLYNGKDVVYDWPGYNNGNTQLGIAQLFSARSEVLSPAGDLTDDRTLGYRKLGPCQYWHEQTTGYEGYSWWTYSTGAPPDTCVVEWIPLLPGTGLYAVETYIPASHSTATGIYHINTQSGWQTVSLDQGGYSDEWASLGSFSLNPSTAMVRMGDFTGTQGQYISFDAIRFTQQTWAADQTASAGNSVFRPTANPMLSSSPVSFVLPEGFTGNISIYDFSGRLIAEIDTEIPAGTLVPGISHAVIRYGEGSVPVRFTLIE